MNSFIPPRKARPGRRILSVLLVIAMLATSNILSVSDVSAATEESSSAAMMLEAIGVISADSTGSYDLNTTLTRAQYAKMLVMVSKYKDQVASSAYSSPFKDVNTSNWATPYIKLAAQNNMLSGYSDGTFRPNNPITLEQGVNSALILLGYTQSDFKGSFPYIQMNMFSSLGLSSGINGGIGTLMTKGMAVQLLYNTLKADVKDATTTYAQSLGYTLNSNGEVDYATVVNDNMNGPYTVTSSNWYDTFGISASASVYKNGSKVSVSNVKTYDIIYYNDAKTTVWAYDDKITGVYDSASPSQDAVTSVTVSGTTYTLGSTSAFTALSSSGNLRIGDAIVLLLGKNGEVADAISISNFKNDTYLYVTESDTTSITGVTPSGSTVSYKVDKNTIYDPGDMIKISFTTNGDMNISSISSAVVSGKASAANGTIGNYSVSPTAKIIDTYEGSYTVTSMSRLSGLTIASGKALYAAIEDGTITNLILNDVTGDAKQYGVVTSATSNSSGSNTYVYDINGTSKTLTLSNTNLNISRGPSMMYGDGGSIDTIKNLTKISYKILGFTGMSLSAADTDYIVSANVKVYKRNDSVYTYKSLSDAVTAYQSGEKVEYYIDKSSSSGGQVRVIIYE
ncbi:S-layer homology domain-containing protein [Clostridium aminobutyricum]|uniref:S-layer homology domain-containing protein n=1 Tax=Clostridium aminobutyricum TaxID=33953 RepID=A0A939DB66_CLOAM|nr:S-layer homology domain-containing protein [Clostridium aminobutyricum]MBN7774531.1 S-layer homology domain-containing protein [Clostridium aminobutyricum]